MRNHSILYRTQKFPSVLVVVHYQCKFSMHRHRSLELARSLADCKRKPAKGKRSPRRRDAWNNLVDVHSSYTNVYSLRVVHAKRHPCSSADEFVTQCKISPTLHVQRCCTLGGTTLTFSGSSAPGKWVNDGAWASSLQTMRAHINSLNYHTLKNKNKNSVKALVPY